MARTVSIGAQGFEDLLENNCFYIDKTKFIREWWENNDEITLITRPRRFGKTLNMSMLERFFSCRYEGQGQIFEGLSIWEDEKYRALQGTYPVIFLSFAGVKKQSFEGISRGIAREISLAYEAHRYLRTSEKLEDWEKNLIESRRRAINPQDAESCLQDLARFLMQHFGRKCLILLDEYDTPMQEAWTGGCWDETAQFMRELFNSAFKTNPFLGRAVMTGITRVSKESIFSDLNNLEVVTTTSDKYADCFGFTEEEVFSAMDEFGLKNKDEVKEWYDGFIFGNTPDIYNPWSITNFLDKGKIGLYWANSSSNSLVGKLLQEGNAEIKKQFETLLQGGSIESIITEDIVYRQLDGREDALWSLLLAAGYLKALSYETAGDAIREGRRQPIYQLTLTNLEVRQMFGNLIDGWFGKDRWHYNGFVKALLSGSLKEMNKYMNEIALNCFSFFDTGERPSERTEPERFYHGFVLGLLVELSGQYQLVSNRESGFGRYDVCLIPKKKVISSTVMQRTASPGAVLSGMTSPDATLPRIASSGTTFPSTVSPGATAKGTASPGIILEFKVLDPDNGEKTLDDTVKSALAQIKEKEYSRELINRGIPKEHIRCYGFAFRGKKVLIGEDMG